MDFSAMLRGADPNRLTSAVQDTFASQGGVDGLVGKLRAGGLAPQVDSWIGTGSNQPVEPQRLGDALGQDTVSQLSSQSGLSPAALLPVLAQFLPMIIDRLTPGGNLPKDGGQGGLGDIGDLIGGALGGGGLGGILGGR